MYTLVLYPLSCEDRVYAYDYTYEYIHTFWYSIPYPAKIEYTHTITHIRDCKIGDRVYTCNLKDLKRYETMRMLSTPVEGNVCA